MATTQKSIAMQRALKDELSVRLSSLTFTESFDASGYPTILIGAAAANSEGCFIRIKQEASLATDILGLAQNVFTPHIIQIAWEGNAGDTAPDPAVNGIATIFAVHSACIRMGAKTQLWLETDGSVPAATTFDTASKLKATYDSLYQPLISGQ